MRVVSALLLGVAASLDNLLIGFCFGLRGCRISSPVNLCIALFSGTAAFLSCSLARQLALLSRIAGPLGGMLLILLGLFPLVCQGAATLTESIPNRNPTPLETLLLSLLVSLNCFPASFAAGLTGLTAFEAAASVTLSSLFFVRLGSWQGQLSGASLSEETLTLLSCLLLVLLGSLELLL
ncbi:MAG: manganese efflux pump [Clostridia bacterium]|nr:manganese efflux pump [Clostridia bacterium]